MSAAVATVATDPLDVLQRIHADVKLLRELVGDALVIEIRQAGEQPQEDAPPARWAPGARRVLDAFEAAPDEWIGSAAIATGLGISRPQVTSHIRRLVKSGALEHNGKGTRGAKYRFVPPPAAAEPVPAAAPVADLPPAGASVVAARAGRSRVLKDVREHGSTTSLETAKRINGDAALVAEELCWLAANGYVEKPYSRYVPILQPGGASR